MTMRYIMQRLNKFFANGYTCREKIGQQLEENKISKSINFRYGKHFVLNAKYFLKSLFLKN